jgi:hypothetical protein
VLLLKCAFPKYLHRSVESVLDEATLRGIKTLRQRYQEQAESLMPTAHSRGEEEEAGRADKRDPAPSSAPAAKSAPYAPLHPHPDAPLTLRDLVFVLGSLLAELREGRDEAALAGYCRYAPLLEQAWRRAAEGDGDVRYEQPASEACLYPSDYAAETRGGPTATGAAALERKAHDAALLPCRVLYIQGLPHVVTEPAAVHALHKHRFGVRMRAADPAARVGLEAEMAKAVADAGAPAIVVCALLGPRASEPVQHFATVQSGLLAEVFQAHQCGRADVDVSTTRELAVEGGVGVVRTTTTVTQPVEVREEHVAVPGGVADTYIEPQSWLLFLLRGAGISHRQPLTNAFRLRVLVGGAFGRLRALWRAETGADYVPINMGVPDAAAAVRVAVDKAREDFIRARHRREGGSSIDLGRFAQPAAAAAAEVAAAVPGVASASAPASASAAAPSSAPVDTSLACESAGASARAAYSRSAEGEEFVQVVTGGSTEACERLAAEQRAELAAEVQAEAASVMGAPATDASAMDDEEDTIVGANDRAAAALRPAPEAASAKPAVAVDPVSGRRIALGRRSASRLRAGEAWWRHGDPADPAERGFACGESFGAVIRELHERHHGADEIERERCLRETEARRMAAARAMEEQRQAAMLEAERAERDRARVEHQLEADAQREVCLDETAARTVAETRAPRSRSRLREQQRSPSQSRSPSPAHEADAREELREEVEAKPSKKKASKAAPKAAAKSKAAAKPKPKAKASKAAEVEDEAATEDEDEAGEKKPNAKDVVLSLEPTRSGRLRRRGPRTMSPTTFEEIEREAQLSTASKRKTRAQDDEKNEEEEQKEETAAAKKPRASASKKKATTTASKRKGKK